MKATRPLLAAALLALSAPADASYSGIQNISLPDNFDGIYLDFTDLNDPSVFTQSPTQPGSWDINFAFAGQLIASSATLHAVQASTSVNDTVLNLAPFTTIDNSAVVHNGASGSLDHLDTGGLPAFNNGVEGFLGFMVEFSGSQYPGWMRVTLQDDGNAGMLHDWAWSTTPVSSGGFINVSVPEASEALVVLLGLTGLLTQRRRRRGRTT